MDNRERDKFYSSGADEDDGDEYELEPPDPEVMAKEERQAAAAIEASRRAIDIDQIYRETTERSGEEIFGEWFRGFRFQFQIKHLLIATAVLAILLTLWQLGVLGRVLTIAIMLTVFIVYFYVEWKEKQRLDEADRRREEMFRRAKELREAGLPPHPDSAPIVPKEVDAEDRDDIDEREQLARVRREFRFQFSLGQLLMVLAVAAVVLGLVNFFGSPNAAATMLGVIALAGLVLHAVGVQPPQIVVLGWWLLLLLYVVLTVFATMWSGG